MDEKELNGIEYAPNLTAEQKQEVMDKTIETVTGSNDSRVVYISPKTEGENTEPDEPAQERASDEDVELDWDEVPVSDKLFPVDGTLPIKSIPIPGICTDNPRRSVISYDFMIDACTMRVPSDYTDVDGTSDQIVVVDNLKIKPNLHTSSFSGKVEYTSLVNGEEKRIEDTLIGAIDFYSGEVSISSAKGLIQQVQFAGHLNVSKNNKPAEEKKPVNIADIKAKLAESGQKLSPDQEISLMLAAMPEFKLQSQILDANNKLDEVRGVQQLAANKIKTMCSDDASSILLARAAALDLKALESLNMRSINDWFKVKEVYTCEDGKVIELAAKSGDEIKFREMHRDFLCFLKSYDIESKKFAVVEEKYKQDIAKAEAEFDAYRTANNLDIVDESSQFVSRAEYYRKTLSDLSAREDISPETKERIDQILLWGERGVTLSLLTDEVRELINKRGSAYSIMHGYRNSYQSVAVQVEKVLRSRFGKYNLVYGLSKFGNAEEQFFPEYKNYNNLFMFILFRYIKYNYERFNNNHMIMLSEIITQLGYLKHAENERPESSARFTESVRTLLSLVINS